jgi:hypothetical protein
MMNAARTRPCDDRLWAAWGVGQRSVKRTTWVASTACVSIRLRPVLALIHHRDRDVADIGVDGVAEQHQLNQRDHDDHAQGGAVAAQLGQLLGQDREDAAIAAVRSLRRPAPVLVTKTSSRLGRTARCAVGAGSRAASAAKPPGRRCDRPPAPAAAAAELRGRDDLRQGRKPLLEPRRFGASTSTTWAPMAAISSCGEPSARLCPGSMIARRWQRSASSM